MPNQKTHKPAKSLAKPQTRRRMMVVVSLLLSLIFGGAALAQWSGLWSVPQKSKPQSAELIPASFDAALPAKEYAYAGGKLVATEEPQAMTCTYTLDSTNQSYPAAASSGSVTVSTQAGCNWTAVSNAAFITVTSGANVTGNGTVQFNVAANSTGAIRNGTITIAGQTFTVYQGLEFADVLPTHPFYAFIGKLAARGVTLGCGGGNYCPDQVVTREQMAAFIIRALGEFSPPTPGSQRFTDVPPSNPFYNFIDRMAVLNITLGCGGGIYCPIDPVTREQMAAFLLRALGEFSPPTPPSQRFNDVPPTNPFYNFIDRMAVLNITQGCSASPPLYCPADSVTRGQMAAFLVRAFNL